MNGGVKTKHNIKYIFVTGGVISGLGKGITAASLGKILTARGFLVSMQKCDPYLNMDAGTLNPAEHGEVFVTADGAETDLDLGHYERFIDHELSRKASTMSGKVFAKVLADERDGKFLGKTIQIIPHITGEMHAQIMDAAKGSGIHIVEIGGTVGDYEAQGWIEAIRQMKRKVGEHNVLYAHVVYVPHLSVSNEHKTKPAQNSVRDLREAGILPNILCVRSDDPINAEAFEKMSLYCDVPKDAIVALPNAKTVYEVPLRMEESGIGTYISKHFGLPTRQPKLREWENLVKKIVTPKPTITVGIVAKYMSNDDTYASVFEALRAAGWAQGVDLDLIWINAEDLEASVEPLTKVHGIVVPGGFGNRGVEGKIASARYARENKLPYLGLCLGMQVAVIEFARKVLEDQAANSAEMDPDCQHPVIDIMPSQVGVQLGGSMRLGDYNAVLSKQSRSYLAYGTQKIVERHRHRFEFNNTYRVQLETAGLVIAGTSPDGQLVEIVEHRDHPFFVASQFHPEFKSRPNRPHPLFVDFVASIKRQTNLTHSHEPSKTNRSYR